MVPLTHLQLEVELLKLFEVLLQICIGSAIRSGIVVGGLDQFLLEFVQEAISLRKASSLWSSATAQRHLFLRWVTTIGIVEYLIILIYFIQAAFAGEQCRHITPLAIEVELLTVFEYFPIRLICRTD